MAVDRTNQTVTLKDARRLRQRFGEDGVDTTNTPQTSTMGGFIVLGLSDRSRVDTT